MTLCFLQRVACIVVQSFIGLMIYGLAFREAESVILHLVIGLPFANECTGVCL